MTLTKWNRPQNGGEAATTSKTPFDLFRDMTDVFDDFFGPGALSSEGQFSNFVPAVNIAEDKENYFVELSAPGYNKEDLKISVDNDVLTISAEHKTEDTTEDKNYSRKEFSCNSFQRSFTLPKTVDPEKINAKYDNGVLKLTLSKKEEAKAKPPRDIKIG